MSDQEEITLKFTGAISELLHKRFLYHCSSVLGQPQVSVEKQQLNDFEKWFNSNDPIQMVFSSIPTQDHGITLTKLICFAYKKKYFPEHAKKYGIDNYGKILVAEVGGTRKRLTEEGFVFQDNPLYALKVYIKKIIAFFEERIKDLEKTDSKTLINKKGKSDETKALHRTLSTCRSIVGELKKQGKKNEGEVGDELIGFLAALENDIELEEKASLARHNMQLYSPTLPKDVIEILNSLDMEMLEKIESDRLEMMTILPSRQEGVFFGGKSKKSRQMPIFSGLEQSGL